jgi:hypothetical protein
MQATLELATNTMHQTAANIYGGEPTYYFSGIVPFQTLRAIPSTQWSGCGCITRGSNIRSNGWAMNLAVDAAVVCPDNDVQSGLMKLFESHEAAYHATNIQYMEPTQLLTGCYMGNAYRQRFDPWMNNFQVQAFAFGTRAMEDSNLLSVLNACLQYGPVGQIEGNTPWRMHDYLEIITLKPDSPYDRVANPFLARDKILQYHNYVIQSDSMTIGWGPNRNGASFMPSTDGDVLYFFAQNEHGDPRLLPLFNGTEVKEGVPYYAVHASDQTCQVAATQGGTPVTITNQNPAGKPGMALGVQPQQWSYANSVNPNHKIQGDDFASMSNAALVIAAKAGATAITQTMLTNAAAFLSSVDYSRYVAWKFA